MRKVLMLKYRHKQVRLYPKHPGEREKGSQVFRVSIGFFLNSEDRGCDTLPLFILKNHKYPSEIKRPQM